MGERKKRRARSVKIASHYGFCSRRIRIRFDSNLKCRKDKVETRRGMGDMDGRALCKRCTILLSPVQHYSVGRVLGGLLDQMPQS